MSSYNVWAMPTLIRSYGLAFAMFGPYMRMSIGINHTSYSQTIKESLNHILLNDYSKHFCEIFCQREPINQYYPYSYIFSVHKRNQSGFFPIFYSNKFLIFRQIQSNCPALAYILKWNDLFFIFALHSASLILQSQQKNIERAI